MTNTQDSISNDGDNSDSQMPLKYVHSWHYDMLANQERSHYYNNLIKGYCKDKIVLEIGTGSGLLAVLAIRHGAQQVICCEENPMLAMAAKQLFKRMNLEDKILFIPKNSKEISTTEIPQVDVVLHELFGSDPFQEEFIPTLRDARRFMKPDAIFLPEKIQLIYQPIPTAPLENNLYFEDIDLIEMGIMMSQVHPALRKRDTSKPSIPFELPPVAIKDFLDQSYSFTEKNDQLIDIDAIEVSFNIIHDNEKLQAAEFATITGRIHWFPLVYYKLDPSTPKIHFSIKNDTKLVIS